MIEILVLIKLTQAIGRMVEEKGRSRTAYKLLTVLLWFGGEIAGAIFGVVLSGKGEDKTLLAYGLALLGAIMGGVLSYVIASRAAPAPGVTQGPLHPKERPDA